jgi:LPXTG-motif cell wall-anchored protein
MDVKRCRRWLAGGVLSLAALSGGTVAASSYPPGDPTPSTVAAGGVSGIRQPDVELAATGSDTDTTLLVAGAAVVAGAGLVVAARLRRNAPAR